jgi:hypothetical protein
LGALVLGNEKDGQLLLRSNETGIIDFYIGFFGKEGREDRRFMDMKSIVDLICF